MTMLINKQFMDELSTQARTSPRLRSHFSMHQSHQDLVQRVYIGAQPGTYVRPHAHMASHKWEYISIVRGAMDFLVFSPQGVLEQRIPLRVAGEITAIEIAPGTWHSLLVQEADTIFFEVKQGPFDALNNADFADWAPEENSAGVDRFMQSLSGLSVGTKITNI